MIFPEAIRWVVALKAEAQPLIKKYRMKLVLDKTTYPIFKDLIGKHWLVISGVGKIHCSAATMLLQNKSESPPWTLWVNLGISGFGGDAYGDLFAVDQILNVADSTKRFPSCNDIGITRRASLSTLDVATTKYETGVLFDMEGIAFFTIASKLVCRELILLLKVVSDCSTESLNTISANTVSTLVYNNIEKIDEIIIKNKKSMFYQYQINKTPEEYSEICSRVHFTVSEKHRLKSLIKSWQTAYPDLNILLEVSHLERAKNIINFLSERVSEYTVDWGK